MKNKLIEVLSIQSESYNQFRMFAYIIRKLKKMECTYYVYNGCIYAQKGSSDSFPCIASHMDTVHDIVEDLTVVEVDGNLTGFNAVTMEQTGIGGDDKVGIFIALQCLQYFDSIKAVFFRDEEVGCDGSYDSDIYFFENCSFVLQCDRRGYGDFIDNASGTQLCGKDFQKDIESVLKRYKYNFTSGMMTDVMALKEIGIKCAMANMSCGYYNPHCPNEYVNVKEVMLCLAMVKDIISEIGEVQYICEYKAPKKFHTSNGKVDSFGSVLSRYGYDERAFLPIDDVYSKNKGNCECCNESGELTFVSDYNMDMCDKCINAYIKIYSV